MKKFLVFSALLFTIAFQAQDAQTGSVAGKLLDKEMGGEPLPFANVLIKGTSTGTTSDYDGLYLLENMEPGTYTLVFSFVGYETLEVPDVVVEAGKVTEVNTELGASAASLDEVVITTVSRRDSEVALLIEQKNSVNIKESIGAQELAKLGVSDVATATTKISGVSSSEASGDIFVRGLGDRYLYTTLNGLPIPSDDVERKNIDLGLFPTRVIQNVSISKNFSPENSADQASGTINIESRELRGSEELSLGVRYGINTNAIGEGSNFKVSPNQDDVYAGFYDPRLNPYQALNNQTWNPQTLSLPVNSRYAITAGKKIGENLSVFFTGSQSSNFEHRQGVFREFRSNFIQDSITDAEQFSKSVNTTGMLDLGYQIDDNNRLKLTSLFINKLTDEVFEGGRNGEASIFEETEPAEGLSQFIRDQNLKQTRLWINQLHGTHDFSEKNELEWALGYNKVDADEPNRIRNEVNFDGQGFVQLGRTGGFQQRKSLQNIDDNEINGFIQDKILFNIEEEDRNIFLQFGGNFRNKKRDFISQFVGVQEDFTNAINPPSIDDLGSIFTTENFNNGLLQADILRADLYNAQLKTYAGFATFNYGTDLFNINLGARYQDDELSVNYDVGNIPGRLGASTISYNNIYPALNAKYSPKENMNIRLAASSTITLPEFKEIAPFEYVSQTGQVTRGNPDLNASRNFNLDLKYEFFPSSGELISLTGFYKKVKDPINKVQDRGSAGIFSYFNAGEEANIYGLELETRLDILENEEPEGFDIGVGLNVSRMWHKQDLKEVRNEEGVFVRTFRYAGKTETGLQGASDWIFNGSVNFSTESENPFRGSLVANYASDKIFALGAPEIQTQSDISYNDEIIEKGFVSLDAVLTKNYGDHWSFQFRGQNLLNPEVKRVQDIKPSTTGIETTETVRSYTRGAVLSLGVNYSF